MDKQLEEYRLRKRRKEQVDSFKDKLRKMIPFMNKKDDGNSDCVVEVHEWESKDKKEINSPIISPICSELASDYESEDDETIFPKQLEDPPDPIIPTDKNYRILFWIVFLMFWLTCYAITIKLKFGVVFLLLSALVGIYYNTRTGPKKPGEISAYSVFNKNCHAIDGTLNAEQFEREIRYGPTSVR